MKREMLVHSAGNNETKYGLLIEDRRKGRRERGRMMGNGYVEKLTGRQTKELKATIETIIEATIETSIETPAIIRN